MRRLNIKERDIARENKKDIAQKIEQLAEQSETIDSLNEVKEFLDGFKNDDNLKTTLENLNESLEEAKQNIEDLTGDVAEIKRNFDNAINNATDYIPTATEDANGLMTKEDFSKLKNLQLVNLGTYNSSGAAENAIIAMAKEDKVAKIYTYIAANSGNNGIIISQPLWTNSNHYITLTYFLNGAHYIRKVDVTNNNDGIWYKAGLGFIEIHGTNLVFFGPTGVEVDRVNLAMVTNVLNVDLSSFDSIEANNDDQHFEISSLNWDVLFNLVNESTAVSKHILFNFGNGTVTNQWTYQQGSIFVPYLSGYEDNMPTIYAKLTQLSPDSNKIIVYKKAGVMPTSNNESSLLGTLIIDVADGSVTGDTDKLEPFVDENDYVSIDSICNRFVFKFTNNSSTTDGIYTNVYYQREGGMYIPIGNGYGAGGYSFVGGFYYNGVDTFSFTPSNASPIIVGQNETTYIYNMISPFDTILFPTLYYGYNNDSVMLVKFTEKVEMQNIFRAYFKDENGIDKVAIYNYSTGECTVESRTNGKVLTFGGSYTFMDHPTGNFANINFGDVYNGLDILFKDDSQGLRTKAYEVKSDNQYNYAFVRMNPIVYLFVFNKNGGSLIRCTAFREQFSINNNEDDMRYIQTEYNNMSDDDKSDFNVVASSFDYKPVIKFASAVSGFDYEIVVPFNVYHGNDVGVWGATIYNYGIGGRYYRYNICFDFSGMATSFRRELEYDATQDDQP